MALVAVGADDVAVVVEPHGNGTIRFVHPKLVLAHARDGVPMPVRHLVCSLVLASLSLIFTLGDLLWGQQAEEVLSAISTTAKTGTVLKAMMGDEPRYLQGRKLELADQYTGFPRKRPGGAGVN